MTIAKLRAARQLWARVAEVVGAGRRCGPVACGHVAADDGGARSVGEHVAHHAGGVLRGRWRRGHRAGSPVRCGDPRWLPRYRFEFRAAYRPQHPTAAAGGVAHRPGARPGGRVVVRRGPHQGVGRAGMEALPGHRIPRRFRRRPRLCRRSDHGGRRAPHRRHRAPAYGAHRGERVPEPRGTAVPARRFVGPVARYAAGFEALRNRSDAFLDKTGSRPKVLLVPLGPLAEHNIRTTFATNLLASGGIEAVTEDARRQRSR